MTARPLNVLISSAGRRVALLRAFREAVSGAGGHVYACDVTALAPAMHVADEGVVVPRCTDPDFIPAVARLCRDRNIGCIVPTIDTELPAYASARQAFAERGVTVMISDPRCVAIGLDKVETHQWLVAEGFPTVRQWSLDEARRRAHGFPLIAKPRRGSASRGVKHVTSEYDLAHVAGEDVIVQECARGEEYTVDVLVNRDGRCLAAVPRRRIEVRAGEVSKGVTCRVASLESLAHDIAERLPGAYGVLNVQIFLDAATGDMRVIEINPRFGGGYPLAHEAGADFVSWVVADLTGLPARADFQWEAGVVMLRYDAAVFTREGATS